MDGILVPTTVVSKQSQCEIQEFIFIYCCLPQRNSLKEPCVIFLFKSLQMIPDLKKLQIQIMVRYYKPHKE